MPSERGEGPGPGPVGARALGGPLVAGLAVGAWTAAFRAYGVFDVADEGTILAQALRVAHGQRPYLDFHTGYGPLHFAAWSWLVAHGGLPAVRAALVVVHGLGAAATYAAARRLVGAGGAALGVLVLVAFLLPVAPRQGAPFFVPYPAWPAGACALGCLLLVDRRRAPVGLVSAGLAGVLAGAAFALKPNSGLLLAAGGVAALVVGGAPPRAGAGVGRLGLAMLLALAAGPLLLVWPPGTSVLWWALVPPVLLLASTGVGRGVPDAEAAPRVLALALGFAAVVGPLYGPPLVALGLVRFAHEALLIGADVAGVYAVEYPRPALVAAVAGVAAAAGRPRGALALGVAALLLAAGDDVLAAPSPLAAFRLAAERVLLVAVPLAAWGGAAALRHGAPAALVAPAAIGATAALQMYPRPDLLHLMAVGPALLPAGLWVGRRAALRLGSAAPSVVAAIVALMAVARLAPGLRTAADVAAGRVDAVSVAGMTLAIEPAAAPRLAAIAEAAAAVAARTAPDQRVMTFPACALVAFAADRLPAGRHDYFFPGRPTRAEGAAIAAEIAAAPPAVAVTCDAAGTDLAAAWVSYPELVDVLATRYRPVLRAPPFVVHEAWSGASPDP